MYSNVNAVVGHCICSLCTHHHNVTAYERGVYCQTFSLCWGIAIFQSAYQGNAGDPSARLLSMHIQLQHDARSPLNPEHYRSDTTGLETGCVSDVISLSSSYDRRLRQLYDVVKHVTVSLLGVQQTLQFLTCYISVIKQAL
jgi:hypothetical protein